MQKQIQSSCIEKLLLLTQGLLVGTFLSASTVDENAVGSYVSQLSDDEQIEYFNSSDPKTKEGIFQSLSQEVKDACFDGLSLQGKFRNLGEISRAKCEQWWNGLSQTQKDIFFKFLPQVMQEDHCGDLSAEGKIRNAEILGISLNAIEQLFRGLSPEKREIYFRHLPLILQQKYFKGLRKEDRMKYAFMLPKNELKQYLKSLTFEGRQQFFNNLLPEQRGFFWPVLMEVGRECGWEEEEALSSKVADKTSWALETLFRNQQ